MTDFSVCPHGACSARVAGQEGMAQRLEELMRRYREDQCHVTYSDLLDVRFGPVPRTTALPAASEVKS